MSLISNDNSWKASVNSVCQRRSVSSKCAPKSSVNSVRSVRERNIQHKRNDSPRLSSAFFFSQKNTEEQNTQHSTEGLRHTENTERYCQRRVLGDGCWVLMIRQRGIRVNLRSHHDASSEGGVTSVITPLSIRRGAGGEASRTPSAYRAHRALLLKVG